MRAAGASRNEDATRCLELQYATRLSVRSIALLLMRGDKGELSAPAAVVFDSGVRYDAAASRAWSSFADRSRGSLRDGSDLFVRALFRSRKEELIVRDDTCMSGRSVVLRGEHVSQNSLLRPRTDSLNPQTRAPNNVAFKVAGSRDSKSNAILGDIEGKYVDPKNGVTFTQTWTTTNVLKTQVELENQIAKGEARFRGCRGCGRAHEPM